jgi:hypothetical protein
MQIYLERAKKKLLSVTNALPSIFVHEKMADLRFNECKGCGEFWQKTLQCGSCKCFMPIKVLIKKSDCPKNKWSFKDENNTSELIC